MENNKILMLNSETLEFTEVNIEDNNIKLELLNDLVQGSIECFNFNSMLTRNNIVCICNEEGKLINLKPSIVVIKKDKISKLKRMVEIIMGNVVFVSLAEDGDFEPLTEEQIKIIKHEIEYIGQLTYDSSSDEDELPNVKRVKVRIMRCI